MTAHKPITEPRLQIKLGTVNKILNLFLLCILVKWKDKVVSVALTTVFNAGYVKEWPHIKLLTWIGL